MITATTERHKTSSRRLGAGSGGGGGGCFIPLL